MFIESFKVESPNVKYTDGEIQSVYNYETTELVHENRNGTYQWIVKPKTVKYEFVTNTNVPKLGLVPKSSTPFLFICFDSVMPIVILLLFWFRPHQWFNWVYFFSLFVALLIFRVMLVGWGGNNGSTLTGGVIANRE